MTLDRGIELFELLQPDLDALPDLPKAEINSEETLESGAEGTHNITNSDSRFIWVTQPQLPETPKLQGETRFIWLTDPNRHCNARLDKANKEQSSTRSRSVSINNSFKQPPSKHRYCPVLPISRFPYKYIHGEQSQLVAERFFDQGKFWKRDWDL